MSPSMIVHELDVIGVAVAPHGADAPLLIDADRVLARRSPDSASSRLPGGTRKSSSLVTVSSKNNFRTARSATSRGTGFGAFPAAGAWSPRNTIGSQFGCL
jgi:hypothetical protein